MKQFFKYIILAATMLTVVVGHVWADACAYSLENTASRVNVVQTGSLGLIKYHNFPNTTLCTLTNSYGISKISFDMKKDGGTNNGDFKLQFYNGSSWEDAKDSSGNSITWNVKNTNTTTVSKQIDPNSTTGKATKFQIVRTSNTNFTSSSRYFTISNIVVVMAKTMSGSEEEIVFDGQVYNTTSTAKTRDFTFSNVETGTSISITSNTNSTEFPAEITKQGDCTGSVTVSVKFKPSQKGTRTGEITVSGDCGSKKFSVTGNGLLATPTLTLKGLSGLVDRTADIANPNYINLSQYIDTYIGDGYKYEVVSSNSQYAHFDGDNFYATEKGEYTIHISSPAGDHYSDTFADGEKYRVLVVTVRDKARPAYKANYTQASADGMFVDGVIENAYTLTNVSKDAYFDCNISVKSISNVNDGTGIVISYDMANNKIVAHNAGTATLQFVQTENNDYYAETSPEYTFTVSKHQTVFGGEAYSIMVDGTQLANYSYTNTSSAQPTSLSSDDFYYTIDNVVFANEALNKGIDLITFNPSTKQITACNAGSAKITLHQKETYKYTGATASYNVTVNKYTPAFTWNTGNVKYYYLSMINNIFSTTNPDCPYTIVSDNEYVAKVIDNALHIYNVAESANITVTQVENYKWYGLKKDYLITPVNGNTHVRIEINDESEYYLFKQPTTSGKVSWDGGVKFSQGDAGFNWDDTYYDIRFEGIPDKLTFDYDAQVGATGRLWFVSEKGSAGDEWLRTEWSSESTNGSASVSLKSSTRYVRFCYSGNLSATIKNIVVTEKVQFETTSSKIDFGTNGINHGKQEEIVTFLHANAGRITTAVIEGADKDYFSVDPVIIPGTGRDYYGSALLYVSFDNRGENRGETPYNAVLVISDNANHRTEVSLIGVRNGKSTPEFIWNPNALPYYFNTTIANIAYSTNKDPNCPLTFETSDRSIAEVVDGNLKIYNKGEEVSIIVRQAENADYVAHADTFTFTPCARPDLEVPFRVSWNRHMKSVQIGSKCDWVDDAQLQLSTTGISDGFVWEDDRKCILVTFGGTPDKLYFDYKASTGSTAQSLSYAWIVEESTNGVDWSEVWRSSHLSTGWAKTGEINLNPRTQYVRISYTGNFAGYVRDIIISSLEGYNYLRAEEGTYLSRGAKYGTQAVADPFGVVCRISHFTRDNVNQYSRFQFVDNMQYLWETSDTKELFTDDKTADNTANQWQVESDASGKFTMRSGNETNRGRYVTIKDNALTFTDDQSEATIWHMESPSEHEQVIKKYMDEVAAWAASKDFGSEVNTLEQLRSNIDNQDFEKIEITIPAVALAQQEGEYRDGMNGTLSAYDHTISGLEPGLYSLSVKAFYRISEPKYAKEARTNNWESVLAYVYANEVMWPIQSVYASHNQNSYHTSDELYDGYYFPTQLQPSAEKALGEANRYLNNVYVYVSADAGKTTGTLSYGIKNPSFVPGAWLVYSTFTLTRIARKEYIFVGGDATYPKDWNTDENWNRKSVPNQNHSVTIQANAEVEQPNAVYSMSIDENKNVHILSTGGLTIGDGGVTKAGDNSIVIDNTPVGAGFFKVDPSADNKPTNLVKIHYTTRAYNSGSPRDEIWQYMGAPGTNMKMTDAHQTMIYHWDEQQGWLKQTQGSSLTPFYGYAFTQTKAQEATFEISANPIIPGEEELVEISLTNTSTGMRGSNVFVNSFLAPIDLTTFDDDDFEGNVEQTFYLFNSGSWNQWQQEGGRDHMNYGVSPGQYYALSPKGAHLMDAQYDQTTIPPMQGVYVIAKDNNAKIKLDYAKHVYNANASNQAMRAPQRLDEDFMRLRLHVAGANCGADRMYVIQHEMGTPDYDNGYDAINMPTAGQPSIYTYERAGQMEISVSDHIDSTYIGFQAGSDDQYTLNITSVIGDGLYLKDLQEEKIVPVVNGVEYIFHATPNSVNNSRFLLVNRLEDDEDLSDFIQAYVSDEIVYVKYAPDNSDMVVYTIGGVALATYSISNTPTTIDLSFLPQGIYVLKIQNKTYKFVCK